MRHDGRSDAAVSRVMGMLFLVAMTAVLSGASLTYFGSVDAKPIPRFPQLILSDAAQPVAFSAPGDPLAVLAHRGGDRLVWADVTVEVLRDEVPATGTAAVAYSAAADCSSPSSTPSGVLEVGGYLHLCAVGGGWAAGDGLELWIVSGDSLAVFHKSETVVQ